VAENIIASGLEQSGTPRATWQKRSVLLPILTAILAAGIFAADTLTNLEIAVPVFYVAVVLIAVRFCDRR